MKEPMVTRRDALVAGLGATALATAGGRARASKSAVAPLAPHPPMGWNSWNSFATTINEAQARETAQIMARELLPCGYDVFTIDIQWYEPNAASYTYAADPVPAMDGYGRLIPAPNRFPSSADGTGFTALASTVHALGMKFGIHLMRGIPRLAVRRNLPILGTRYRAADIANTESICPWNPDMYGVDMTRPGAQAYYDSVFALYAGWGIDFVKMDDMSRPYDAHVLEIEAATKAIAASRRPIILSLSPGETPLDRGEHVSRHAQMWRISDDFWDEWSMLEAQFARLADWTRFRRPGAWPDADMLPLGRLALGKRDTKFTAPEQRTLMTLWCVARSPLIMGGDLRYLDAPTRALLTNREVIAVNQSSRENRPHFIADKTAIWSARVDGSDDFYVALFNLDSGMREVALPLNKLGFEGAARVRDLWRHANVGLMRKSIGTTLAPHDCALYRVHAL
ncbi:glycoside hydrolase family 27 protein [Sphingomonas sp. JC676]|uniref:glycoside hydrolase family 27 protein n=1 Tax=Sphingomonas sp. JC676 TaxID=2768065 RepID=UPI00165817EF|nr:glycoside hydrolase family 27 protein [Sphingomonas sp. JC676]MBC9035165.1 glycoside hydrolase family 27 protein [Sphingomonas sp. JC676]